MWSDISFNLARAVKRLGEFSVEIFTPEDDEVESLPSVFRCEDRFAPIAFRLWRRIEAGIDKIRALVHQTETIENEEGTNPGAVSSQTEKPKTCKIIVSGHHHHRISFRHALKSSCIVSHRRLV